MTHSISSDDERFIADLESGKLPASGFDHRAHVRAAYIYLTASAAEPAAARMRDTLVRFLGHHGIDVSKYHETMTRAWILAVRHFMELTPSAASADAFIDANPQLLDSKIMLSHYSAAVLFSPAARRDFLEPDQSPIPRHS
jgi:hypothetical protein